MYISLLLLLSTYLWCLLKCWYSIWHQWFRRERSFLCARLNTLPVGTSIMPWDGRGTSLPLLVLLCTGCRVACWWFRWRWLWVHSIFYSISEHFKWQNKQNKKHLPWCLLPVLLTSLLHHPYFGRLVSSSISLQCVGQCPAMTRSNDQCTRYFAMT